MPDWQATDCMRAQSMDVHSWLPGVIARKLQRQLETRDCSTTGAVDDVHWPHLCALRPC